MATTEGTLVPDEERGSHGSHLGRAAAARARLQAGAVACVVGLHQLRHLVHDHLGPRGDLHDVRVAWQNGGPIAASIGWPVLCAFVLMVAFSMAELTSRYPTAGGPYWWAHDLGGKGWSWMTGWFNIVGPDRGSSPRWIRRGHFPQRCARLYGVDIFSINFADDAAHPQRDLAALLPDPRVLHGCEHLRRPVLGALQQHLGRLAHHRGRGDHRAADLRARRPPERELRLRRAHQQLGPARRLDEQPRLLAPGPADRVPADDVYRRPATTPPRTPPRRPRARPSPPLRACGARSSSPLSSAGSSCSPSSSRPTTSQAVNDGAGFVGAIFTSALDSWAAKLVLIIATVGQIFCGAAGLTSCFAHLVRVLT